MNQLVLQHICESLKNPIAINQNCFVATCPACGGVDQLELYFFETGQLRDKVGTHCNSGCTVSQIAHALPVSKPPLVADSLPRAMRERLTLQKHQLLMLLCALGAVMRGEALTDYQKREIHATKRTLMRTWGTA